MSISGKQVKAGATVTVTVRMDDDGGLQAGDRMCLFQIVADTAPQPHSTDGYPDYAIPPGSKFVKVANCQRPAPDDPSAGPDGYDSGSTKYRLKVTSNGWLAFAAFREQNGTRVDTGGPILSNVVRVSGPGGAQPGAAAAKVTVLSMDPPHEPAFPSGSPPGNAESTDPSGDLHAPPAATVNFSDDPSSDEAADEQAAREARPKLRWLAATGAAGILLGGLLTGVTMTLWSRRRAKKP